MKICFIPIDNRPVCYNLAKDIVAIDEKIDFFIPPRYMLGDLDKKADIDSLLNWLDACPNCDAIILSLDTLVYGGLIPSRRSADTFEELKDRINYLKQILIKKEAKIYAFSSIMRISNNNYNEEEKEYWKDYGKKIFEYSFSGGINKSDIPQEIIDDYLKTRKRNFEINKLYLELQKKGLFEALIFSKDDCAEAGFNVEEAKALKKLGAKIKTGADEIPLSLLAKSIEKNIKVFVEFTEPDYINLVSNYEDLSIKNSVLGQLELAGFQVTNSYDDSDLVLLVNNFRGSQGELVMGWATEGQYDGVLNSYNKPFVVADVRYANGADNVFVEKLLSKIELSNFYGYAGWNTSANTLGSVLACAKVRFNAEIYNNDAFKKLQLVRFLDDWAYQANVRGQIEGIVDISEMMRVYEGNLIKKLELDEQISINYSYPWKRKFEIEVDINL